MKLRGLKPDVPYCFVLGCRNEVYEFCIKNMACLYHCRCPESFYLRKQEIADSRNARNKRLKT